MGGKIVYDPVTGRYRDTETGRFVTKDKAKGGGAKDAPEETQQKEGDHWPQGPAREGKPEKTEKEEIYRRYGPKDDQRIGEDGSVSEGTHVTSENNIKDPKDELDLPKQPEGYRDIKVPEGTTHRNGTVPGNEFGGKGGKKETIIDEKLPPGSAGEFHDL